MEKSLDDEMYSTTFVGGMSDETAENTHTGGKSYKSSIVKMA